MAATAAFAGSCTNEENVNTPQSDGTVSFQVSLPVNLGTRAYGDGENIKKLYYCVYDDTKGTATAPISAKQEINLEGLSATVNIQLVKGKKYSIAFWADAGIANLYTYNEADRTITVNYSKANAQDETRDAFYAYLSDVSVTTANSSNTVTLRRPFAQVNIGASDFEEAQNSGLTINQTGLKVTKAGTVLNLKDGSVTKSTDPITFSSTALPNEDFPYNPENMTIKYLSMNYILVGADDTIDVTLTAGNGSNNTDITYTQIPVKQNYRTNVYGSLLTNTASFNVTIEPSFNESDINHQKDNSNN